MQRRKGSPLTPAERAEIWRLYKAGKPGNLIGRLLGRPATTIHYELMSNGGFTPRRPKSRAARLRSLPI